MNANYVVGDTTIRVHDGLEPGAAQLRRQDAIAGVLLGMAVGDAIGLPWEGLSARRGRRLFGSGGLRHRFFFGRGMVSDDTEHAVMTAQALLAAGNDIERFQRSLAWRLRFWLLGVPAGIGLGTLRAILKLWLGFSPSQSGVKSAGNGPAMRAPIIGAVFTHYPETMRAVLSASTRMTHRDTRAEQGALAIAAAAAFATEQGATASVHGEPLRQIRAQILDGELQEMLDNVADHLNKRSTPEELAAALGLANGVTGYIHHTTAVALFCWLRYPGFSSERRVCRPARRRYGYRGRHCGCVGRRDNRRIAITQGVARWPDRMAALGRLAPTSGRTCRAAISG